MSNTKIYPSETRFFYKQTYCPYFDRYVTYQEGCSGCDYNEYYSHVDETVDCSYPEGDTDEY